MRNQQAAIPPKCTLQELPRYVDLPRFQNRNNAILNMYYRTNLLQVVDKCPEQLKKPEIQLYDTNPGDMKIDDQHGSLPKFNNVRLEDVVLTYKHECDGLGNEVFINEYKVMKALLGKGSYSFVKLAKKDNHSYAIKTIAFEKLKKKFYIKDQHLISMMNNQIQLLKKLRSTNIVHFQQAIYSPAKQKLFLIMENCSKGSLLKIISQNEHVPLPQWLPICKKYFYSMAKGIKTMHDQNIIHRDIKSENILVNNKDEVKIIDFNVSAEVAADGMIKVTDKFIGTKIYAPPELVIPENRQRLVNGKLADVWGLGITLLELLERRHPFGGSKFEELIQFVSNPVQINKNFDQALRSLLESMLKFNNKERMGINQILKHPWLKD